MRVTDRQMFETAAARLAVRNSELQRELAQLSSGRAVERPSDDPVRYEQGRQAVAQGVAIDAYQRSAEAALASLDQADGALAQMQTVLQRVLELTVQGASEQYTQQERDGMALEVQALRAELIGMANTRVGDRYLLGGAREDAPSFAADGSYQGSVDEVQVEVAPGLRASTRLDGSRLLATQGRSLFDVVGEVAQALASGDIGALQAAVGGVQQAGRDLATAQAEVGSGGALAAQAVALLQADAVQSASRSDQALAADTAAVTSRLALTLRALEGLEQVIARSLSRGILDL